MAKEKSIFDPKVVFPKIKLIKKRIGDTLLKRKKIVAGTILILIFLAITSFINNKKAQNSLNMAKTLAAKIDKSFDFPALDNLGKSTKSKIKFKIVNTEKTNQVAVKDQVFTAKNNKMFLIVNLELKNDEAKAYNILPGDLIRLTYNRDEENKFAPDLHNNLVPVAAISTKIDRIGFVIPGEAKEFKLIVGELEGKKEEVSVSFPS